MDEIEFFRPKEGEYRQTVFAPAVVTSHSCDFTKFCSERDKGGRIDLFPLLVAPLVRRSALDPGTAGHAVKDRVPRYFAIPPEPPLDDEGHLVDFWFMQPVAVLELLACQRLASMTDAWQQRLQRGLDRFFSWEDRKKPLGDPG